MASDSVTPATETRPAPPPAARPNMMSLEDFLNGPPPPPRPPIPWVKVIIGTIATVIVIGIAGYYSILGERSAKAIWVQVGKNMDRRNANKVGAPSFDLSTKDVIFQAV